jgi:hypothetical protein
MVNLLGCFTYLKKENVIIYCFLVSCKVIIHCNMQIANKNPDRPVSCVRVLGLQIEQS